MLYLVGNVRELEQRQRDADSDGGTTVAANTACEITFTLTNPTSDLTSPDVSVEAALTDGISGGLAPLKVVVPTFSTKTIQQSSPVSGASNVMTVTLTANYDLTTTGGASDATVTITGLAGS